MRRECEMLERYDSFVLSTPRTFFRSDIPKCAHAVSRGDSSSTCATHPPGNKKRAGQRSFQKLLKLKLHSASIRLPCRAQFIPRATSQAQSTQLGSSIVEPAFLCLCWMMKLSTFVRTCPLTLVPDKRSGDPVLRIATYWEF